MKASPATLAAALLVCALALVGLASKPAQMGSRDTIRASRPAPSALGVARLREGEPLDLNRANAGDLLLLPGVGPKLAQRIIDARTRRSGFASVDELQTVKGIGRKKLAKLRALVRVNRTETSAEAHETADDHGHATAAAHSSNSHAAVSDTVK